MSAEEARAIAYLYEAGLDRDGNIDAPGLNFWIDVFEGGSTLAAIAEAFLDSEEFQASAEAFLGTGIDITDANVRDRLVFADFDFVTLLYENVLDRAADDPGRDFWLSVLDRLSDTAPDARAQLLIAFAESGENLANSPGIDGLAEVAPGVWDFV